MNRHALDVLQFAAALDVVARHASTPLGAAAVRVLTPVRAADWIRQELARVAETLTLLERAEDFGVPAIPDLRAALKMLGVAGSVWEAPTLREAAELLRSARLARAALADGAGRYPRLAPLAARLQPLDAEAERIRRAVDDAGQVRDDASRELARLRREMRGARSRIVAQLEKFMGSLPERARVQDASVTVREGRFVIPVRRDARGDVGGLVHDESASGATLFVEPPVALELMNRLREMELEEGREVRRILRDLTAALRPHRHVMAEDLEALVELDALVARARYAGTVDARVPAVEAGGPFRVVSGRHPLLLASGASVVPFDLSLEPDERTMVVSGPNTGGKTVLLKSIGLLSLLAQAGVIPPVGEGSALPLFTDVFADIGDEQSIEASLSTFSAHLGNLRVVLAEADGASLVLIDEVGSGTDPTEGAALARAVLLDLNGRGALTVATSHLGELKLLAGRVAGVVNASLQFDAAELEPTYRLLKGVPGRSYGLAIARRLGLPANVLREAERALPREERDVGRLLAELESRERELATALDEARLARTESEELRAELEGRSATVRRRERDAERRARQQARDLLLQARAEVEATIRDLREAAGDLGGAELEAAFRAARARVEERARMQAERTPEPVEPATAPALQDVRPGDRVRVEATGAPGTVVEVRDGKVLVETRGVRMQVALAGLAPLEGEPVRARGTSHTDRGGWSGPDVPAASEVDLRGLRAEEVEGRLYPALDAAIQAALPALRIIHGKGTGALREVVAELLEADPRITSWRSGGVGEGGSGVTVVAL
jgi:DNA mismatch repair protein MutS2